MKVVRRKPNNSKSMDIHKQALTSPHRQEVVEPIKMFCEVCGCQMTPGRPCPNCGASQC